MLTRCDIAEANNSQPILPVGQASGRGTEDGEHSSHDWLGCRLTSLQGKQTGEDGGIVRQTTE